MNRLVFIVILSSSLSFIFNIVLAKFLGAKIYGEIQLYTAFIQIFLLFISLNYASLYMGNRIVRNDRNTFGLFISLQTLLFIILILPAYLIINIFLDDRVIIVLILILSYLLVLLTSVSLEFNALHKVFDSILIGSVAARLVHIVTFLLAVWMGSGNSKFYFITYLLSIALLLTYALYQLSPKLNISFEIFSRAWKFYTLGLIGGSFIYIAQILQKEFYDYEQLASLAIVLLIMNGLGMWSSLLIKITLPIAHQYWKSRKLDKLSYIYRSSTFLELVVVIPLFLLVSLNINNISNMLGVGYSQLPMFFYIISLGYIIEHVTGISGTLLRVTENENFELFNEIIRLIVGLLLIFLLSQYEYGIAVAIAISTIVYSALKFGELYYLFKMWPLNKKSFKQLLLLILVNFPILYLLATVKNIYIEVLLTLAFLCIIYYLIYNYILVRSKLIQQVN